MPIEVQIEKTYGKNTPVEDFLARLRLCGRADRAARTSSAASWRLEQRHTTMAYKSEADEIVTLGKIPRRAISIEA
jgi:hypothetical protein